MTKALKHPNNTKIAIIIPRRQGEAWHGAGRERRFKTYTRPIWTNIDTALNTAPRTIRVFGSYIFAKNNIMPKTICAQRKE